MITCFFYTFKTKIGLSTLFFFTTIFSSYSQDKITYKTEGRNSYIKTSLTATVENSTYTLIDSTDEVCFSIEKKSDFNNDGYDDALVRIINGCGGNCCGDSYQIYAFNGTEFIKTKRLGYDWDEIEILEQKGHYSFIIETTIMGVGNTDICEDKTETFRFTNFEFELMEVEQEERVDAIFEINGEDFLGKENEELIFLFDLDSDSKIDTIYCQYWDRWGILKDWKIHFASGKRYVGNSSPKRIGILNSKNNGVFDLVLNCSEIILWLGERYNH